MTSIVSGLLSWSVLVGFVLGFIANRAAHLLRACWLDKHRPRPDGTKRSKWKAVAIDPRAFAALVMICTMSWSVYRTQENANLSAQISVDAKAFADKTRACQTQLILSQTGSRQVTAEYNAEAERQRLALVEWLRTLVSPPPTISALPAGSEQRQAWALGVTSGYLREIQLSQKDQADAVARRPPLPDPFCD